jgi:hypothetical protein
MARFAGTKVFYRSESESPRGRRGEEEEEKWIKKN